MILLIVANIIIINTNIILVNLILMIIFNTNNSNKYSYNTYNVKEKNLSKNQHKYSHYNLIQTPIGIRSA